MLDDPVPHLRRRQWLPDVVDEYGQSRNRRAHNLFECSRQALRPGGGPADHRDTHRTQSFALEVFANLAGELVGDRHDDRGWIGDGVQNVTHDTRQG